MKFFLIFAALTTVAFAAEFHFFFEDKEIVNDITKKFDFKHFTLRKGDVADVVLKSPKNIVDDKIIAFLEEIREKMGEGFPESGIPPLDPFTLEKASLRLNQPLIFSANINIENILMTGLQQFIIEKVSFNILRLSFDFDLVVPAINFDSDFNVDGRIAVVYPFDFGGVARMRMDNFDIGGRTQLGTNSGGFLTLRSLVLSLDAERLTLQLSGIEGDGPLNDLIDWLGEKMDQEFVHNMFASISESLSDALFESINDILGGISLGDLLG